MKFVSADEDGVKVAGCGHVDIEERERHVIKLVAGTETLE